jgi:hypothetical protein
MSNTKQQPADTSSVDAWVSFDDAYEAFVQAHPMLGLGSGLWATTNLRRNYGPRLLESGAVIQLVNRRWLAHREKFGPALFELLTKTGDEILQKARARQAEQAAAAGRP